MKKFILIIVLAALQISLFAQDEARLAVKQDMPLLYDNIAKKAALKWPGDFEMQKYTIEKQCEAYIEYRALKENKAIPDDIHLQVSMGALTKWCENDWVNCIKENKEAGADAINACFSADWEMVVFEMKKQYDAYNSLK